jgi:hypothetical protein
MYSNGEVWTNNALVTTIPNIDFSKPSVVSMAVGGGQIWVRVNGGNWNGDAAADPVAGVGGQPIPVGAKYFQVTTAYYRTYGLTSVTVTSVPPFAYPVPAGHQVWPSFATTAPLALSGTSPTNLNDGNVWFDGNNLALRSQGVTYSLDKRPAGDTFDPLTATGTMYGYFSDGNATISSINYQYYTTARSCVVHDLNNYEFYYLEFTIFNSHPGSWLTVLGLGTAMLNYNDGGWPGHIADSVGVGDDGTIWNNNLQLTPTLGTFPTGISIFGVAVGGGKVWFRINGGNWNGDPAARPGGFDTTGGVTGVGGITVPAGAQHFIAAVSANNKAAVSTGLDTVTWATVNTAGPFAYTPPDGFIPWLVLPDTAFDYTNRMQPSL